LVSARVDEKCVIDHRRLTLKVDFGIQVCQFLKTRFIEPDLVGRHARDDKVPKAKLLLNLRCGQCLVLRIRDDLDRRLISLLEIPGKTVGRLAGLDESFEGLEFIQVILELPARPIRTRVERTRDHPREILAATDEARLKCPQRKILCPSPVACLPKG